MIPDFPTTRSETYLAAILGQDVELPEPQSRTDLYLANLAGMDVAIPDEPQTRSDFFLAKICGQDVALPVPQTRMELYLSRIAGQFCPVFPPQTRLEEYLAAWDDASAVYATAGPGSIVTFTTLRAAPLKSLTVALNPIQDLHGYNNPWPAGGGKNLVNVPDNSGTVTNYYFREIALGFAPVAGVEYTVSLDATSTVTPFNFTVGVGENSYAADIKTTAGWENGRVYATFTLTSTQLENRPNLFIRCPRYGTQQTFNWTIKNVQLEIGSPATSFAPYSNICPISGHSAVNVWVQPTHDTTADPTATVTIPPPPGTVYGGTLDVLTGVLTVDRVMYQFDGTENWRYDTAYSAFVIDNFVLDARSMNSSVPNAICSAFVEVRRMQASTANGRFVLNSDAHTANRLYIKNTAYDDTTINDFAASLIGQTIVYELATPVTYQLTPEEVTALLGQNNIWADTGNVTVEYRSN